MNIRMYCLVIGLVLCGGMLFCGGAFGQDNKPAVKDSLKIKPASKVKLSVEIDSTAIDTVPIRLVLRSDVELVVTIDDVRKETLTITQPLALRIAPGKHEVRAFSRFIPNSEEQRLIELKPTKVDTLVYSLQSKMPHLFSSIVNRDTVTFYLLLNAGADPNALDKVGDPVLFYTIINNHANMTLALLDRGAQVNAKNKTGYTPLITAAKVGNLQFVKLLIDRGADVNAITDDERFPLFYAVLANNPEMVKLLVDKGANLNVRDQDKRTPVMRASEYGYFGCLKVLTEAGANLNMRDPDGGTALSYAVSKGNIEIANYLRSKGAR